MIYTTIDSPLGELLLTGDGEALTGLHIREGRRPVEPAPGTERAPAAFAAAEAQLGGYFAGERWEFDLALDERAGTPFQRQVWNALREIPYGETASYGELAERVGRPTAVRAVGAANGRNPISVIVPCHRVIGTGGSLTGYGGGLERKRLLLELEQSCAALRC